jgi:stalled ribosome alternative rescue factor ArfA
VVVRRLDEVAVFRDLFRARVERKGVHGPHYRKMLMNQAQMYN